MATGGTSSSGTKMSGNTQMFISKVPSNETTNFIWTIENFSLLDKKKRKKITLANLSTSGGYTWALDLYPHGTTSASEDYIGLFLLPKNRPKLSSALVRTKLKFNILNLEGNIIFRVSEEYRDYTGKERQGWGNSQFMKRSTLFDQTKGYLINDKLTIGLELSIIEEVQLVQTCTIPKFFNEDDTDYSAYLESGKLSDVDIVDAEGHVIRAHTIILCGKSSVFDCMFEHKMKETMESKVVISDIMPTALQAMLKYMYSRKFEHPDNIELVQEVLCAADKYDVGQLKKFCENVLMEKMSSCNVINTFILSDAHGLLELKARAINFIYVNKEDLVHSLQWKTFVSKHPQLADEAINGNGPSPNKRRRV